MGVAKELGLRRVWSLAPFAKGTILVYVFELQPYGHGQKRMGSHFGTG